MIKVSDLKINVEETFGKQFFITGVRDNRIYKDGESVGIDGLRYEVACPNLGFEKFTVSVSGDYKDEYKSLGNNEPCSFKGLDISLYQDFNSKEIKVSATAKEVLL